MEVSLMKQVEGRSYATNGRKDIRGACGTKQRWLNNENAYASFKDFSTCPQSINWMICRPTKYSLLLTKLANISSGRKVG